MDTPANVVVVLLDSLNRHMLGSYGSNEFDTPNLDRFAARSSQFTSHVTGSLPCMPARHDILVGALDFLWKPWGSIELWEESITASLRRANIATMLVSDHPHLFESGGENYHTDFGAWEYLRGHEGDPWKTYADPSAVGAPTLAPNGRPLITNAADGGWFIRDQFGIADGLHRCFGSCVETCRKGKDAGAEGGAGNDGFHLLSSSFDSVMISVHSALASSAFPSCCSFRASMALRRSDCAFSIRFTRAGMSTSAYCRADSLKGSSSLRAPKTESALPYSSRLKSSMPSR